MPMNEEEHKPTIFDTFGNWYKGLPDKKRYAEFVTAFLSIPVLLTVIISNVNNLNNKSDDTKPVTTPTTIVQYVPVQAPNSRPQQNQQSTPTGVATPTSGDCKKEVGPVDVSYPSEGSVVVENPVTIDISYHPGEYCAVVWSYRINGGGWSQFDDKSIALFNMPEGDKRLELRVKSLGSGQEVFVVRNFYYQPIQLNSSPTPEATQSAMVVRG